MLDATHEPERQPIRRCGAKTRAGGKCGQLAMPNGRCYFHGGKNLGGIASPTFKHGRYSKFLPVRLLATYKASLSDPDLLALREQVAVLDARLVDVLKRVDTGESSRLWRQLRAAHGALLDARARSDTAAMAARLNDLGGLIGEGVADYAAWADVRALIQERRQVVESERKRMVEMQMMITSDRAMVLLAAVVDTIRRHVTDRSTLAAISADIGSLVAGETRLAIEPARSV